MIHLLNRHTQKFQLPNSSLLIIFFLMIIISGCQSKTNSKLVETDAKQYKDSIDSWHKKREEQLKAENGWLNLAGLYWLKEGENTFGSDSTNAVIFPKGKIVDKAGIFILSDSTVKIRVNDKVVIKANDNLITEATIFFPDKDTLIQLAHESLRWNIIKRGDKFGVRLRDLASPEISKFKGVDRFPVDLKWHIEAKFEAYNPAKKISITNVLGQKSIQESPGFLSFEFEGKKYQLDVIDSDKKFFIVFADETSARETYGAGRFLDIEKTVKDAILYIDFNKSYNPPCAFTPFATCPLPPKQNFLPISILAGEKTYGTH